MSRFGARASRTAEKVLEKTTTRQPAHVLNAERGVVNMPSRAIAAILLRAGGNPIPHKELYTQASEYGQFNSRRHFKHVLKMMKGMKRIAINCTSPKEIGSPKMKFTVNLTARGEKAYRDAFGDHIPLPPSSAERLRMENSEQIDHERKRGLADALDYSKA